MSGYEYNPYAPALPPRAGLPNTLRPQFATIQRNVTSMEFIDRYLEPLVQNFNNLYGTEARVKLSTRYLLDSATSAARPDIDTHALLNTIANAVWSWYDNNVPRRFRDRMLRQTQTQNEAVGVLANTVLDWLRENHPEESTFSDAVYYQPSYNPEPMTRSDTTRNRNRGIQLYPENQVEPQQRYPERRRTRRRLN
jgi:hypothetical protein